MSQELTLEQYLQTSYRPDVEFVDGLLKERAVNGFQHGVVQGLIGLWFRNHRKLWGVLVSIGTRTRIDQERVRLPDVVVVKKGEQTRGALIKAPLIAIEVLSPSNSYADLKARATDLRTLGVENVWLIDEERRTAKVWTGTHWQPVPGRRIETVHAPVCLDLDWLWAELDDE